VVSLGRDGAGRPAATYDGPAKIVSDGEARGVSAGRPRLPEPVRNRLVTLLLEVEDLHDPDSRGLVVSELRNRLGPGFDVPMQKSDRLYTIALVEECQRHYGGLRKLVDALRLTSPGHYRVDEAAELVAAHIPLEILHPPERADLRKLLAALTSEVDAASLYRAAAGPLAPPLESAPNDLLGVVDELVNMMTPPGQLPPLLVFVEYLAASVDGRGQTAQALRRWNEDVVRRCELPPQLVAAARESAHFHTTKPGARASLLVQVEEDGLDHNRYQVSVWLWLDTDSQTLARDDHSYTLSEIPNVVDRALLECGSMLVSDSVEPMVEFILPHRLLMEPVDRWLITQGGPFRSRLGVYYPVVVRSLDRLRTTSLPLRQQWRAKWRWLQEHSGLHPESAVRWMVEDDGRDPQRLYRELTGDQPVAVAWPGPPPPEHQAADSVLGAAVWAGMPVALWCREHHGEGGHLQLTDLLAKGPLPRLPDHALQARREAGAPDAADDHCGHHLSLLWDDPSRLPEPRFGLSAPSATGGSPP
jgi:hypothetical protein